jgi:hypothetical protein
MDAQEMCERLDCLAFLGVTPAPHRLAQHLGQHPIKLTGAPDLEL